MLFKKIVRTAAIAGLMGAVLSISTIAAAQTDDGQSTELGDCLRICRTAYAGTGYTAGYDQCVSSCIERYDGGYGNDPGSGTTPVNPRVCSWGSGCWGWWDYYINQP